MVRKLSHIKIGQFVFAGLILKKNQLLIVLCFSLVSSVFSQERTSIKMVVNANLVNHIISIDSKGTTEINSILKELKLVKGKGILFGHQDDLAYGMGWSYIDGESDVKRVAGDYPALFGWELGGVELGNSHNLDSVPFEKIRDYIQKVNEMGGINTISWHSTSPINSASSWSADSAVVKHILPGGEYHDNFRENLEVIGNFLISLKTKSGTQIPFIFRPWHEMNGDWFWWGTNTCTPEEYKELFRMTINYLRHEKGLSEMAVAYSPDRDFNSVEEYLTWYPGDKFVDIMGLDDYHDFKSGENEELVIRKLQLIIEASRKHAKLAAFTETGLENVTDPEWFTEKLGRVLSDSLIRAELSYVMLWRNDPRVHYFFTYPGHPAEKNAREFLRSPEILLLNDFNELKKKSKKYGK